MLRLICLLGALAMLLPPAGVAQQAQEPAPLAEAGPLEDRLWDSLRMPELMEIMREEVLAEAAGLDLGPAGPGGDGWLASVEAIHAPERMASIFREALERAIRDVEPALLGESVAFYETGLGRRLVGLESSARRAMLDEGAEEDARNAVITATRQQAPRAAQIDRLVEAADLIEMNVAGAMNAAVAFARGFDAGGGYPVTVPEAQILADAWAQEPEIRAETEGWMRAYLMLALSPLSDAEVEEYIAFAVSDAGQALSVAMFAGFDQLFAQTSREMGMAAARQLQGRDL